MKQQIDRPLDSKVEQTLKEFSQLSSFMRRFTAYPPFDYQQIYVNDYRHRFIVMAKSRQIGGSLVFAAKALLKALAFPRYRCIFVTLSLDEAKEKVEYARELYGQLSDHLKLPRIAVDNRLELRFANGSRLQCLFTPRGRYRADLILDEFAYNQKAREIYRAAMPILSLGGQITVASSVTSSASFFHEIWSGRGGKFGAFTRYRIYWWDSPLHCRDVEAARYEAPSLPTEERVERYGTDGLREVFDSMLLEDFQREFELRVEDDQLAFLPWELIMACTPTGEGGVTRYESPEELLDAAGERPVYLGYDVGRHVDKGELAAFVDEGDDAGGLLVERYFQTFAGVPFAEQRAAIERLLQNPRAVVAVDRTGLGEQLAEELLAEWGEYRVVPVHFGAGGTPNVLATGLKVAMERGQVRFVHDRNRSLEMFSVKRESTEAGRVRYVVDSRSGGEHRHHADVFWARALAIYAWSKFGRFERPRISCIEVG